MEGDGERAGERDGTDPGGTPLPLFHFDNFGHLILQEWVADGSHPNGNDIGGFILEKGISTSGAVPAAWRRRQRTASSVPLPSTPPAPVLGPSVPATQKSHSINNKDNGNGNGDEVEGVQRARNIPHRVT